MLELETKIAEGYGLREVLQLVSRVSYSYSRSSFMTFVSASQFHVYLLWCQFFLAWCLNSVLGAFNQEKVHVNLREPLDNLHLKL